MQVVSLVRLVVELEEHTEYGTVRQIKGASLDPVFHFDELLGTLGLNRPVGMPGKLQDLFITQLPCRHYILSKLLCTSSSIT